MHIYVFIYFRVFIIYLILNIKIVEEFLITDYFFEHDLFSHLFKIVYKPLFLLLSPPRLTTVHSHYFNNYMDFLNVICSDDYYVIDNVQVFPEIILLKVATNVNLFFFYINDNDLHDLFFEYLLMYHVVLVMNVCTNFHMCNLSSFLIFNNHNL